MALQDAAVLGEENWSAIVSTCPLVKSLVLPPPPHPLPLLPRSPGGWVFALGTWSLPGALSALQKDCKGTLAWADDDSGLL